MWERILWLLLLLTFILCHEIIMDNGVQMDKSEPNETRDEEENVESVITDIKQDNVVETKYGPVRGHEIEGTDILQYLDIPYAAYSEISPFQDPAEPESWEAIREITEHSSRCPQLASDGSYTGTYDCLSLSVFVKKEAKNADVLFHVHDGSFVRGSGDPRIYGPGYLVPENIVLVLPNYRLGPLGFLCLNNSTAPGNAALKDLTMALNWTRENIEAFGGNPLNIVVSGTGTGAALSQYLALAPKSRDYVSKVITESGCILSHWAIDRSPLETASQLVRRLNASEVATGSNNLLNTSLELIITAANGLEFRPCIENQGYLNKSPWNLLQDLKLNKSFMIGAADRPGLHKALGYTEESISALNKDFGLLLPNDLAFRKREEEQEIGMRVKVQYFGNETITLEHLNELALCHSDCSYLSPGIRSSRLLVAAGSTVYLYEFSFVKKEDDTETHSIHGAPQGASLSYVFQNEKIRPLEDKEEGKMITLMTNLWISFIRTGKPTSESIEWEEFRSTNASEEAWLSIDSETELKKGFHLDRLSLWTEIYNEHFIERNSCTKTTPSIFSACIVLLIFTNNNST